MTLTTIIATLVSLIAGLVASISGAGIGSLITPTLAFEIDLKLAIAVVAIPHLAGSAVRFWMMRRDVDREVLLTFGVMSAIFGILGALLHAYTQNQWLVILFGVLLVLAGLAGMLGLHERVRLGRTGGYAAGAVSGFLGGWAGEQGGFRSAALLGFNVSRDAFIATATAVGLIIDVSRTPVYLWTQWERLSSLWGLIALLTTGVVAGTVAGRYLLARIPQDAFKRIVSGAILAIGVLMLLTLA